jgi:hypothetical protein
MQMFKDLGLTQLFTRPRTPDDHPFVEVLFGTVKTAPAYPGWFPSNDAKGVTGYFARYFTWYDHEHYHSWIGYVTPFQKHTGQAETIIMQRKKQLTAQREQRKEYWLLQADHTCVNCRTNREAIALWKRADVIENQKSMLVQSFFNWIVFTTINRRWVVVF